MIPLAVDAAQFSIAGISAAFAGGVISFASPCVLPLVPAYLSYVSGVSFGELQNQTRRVVMSTVAFILGFTVIFVLLGAGIGQLSSALQHHQRLLQLIGGALVIVMGVVMAGFGGKLFMQEKRLHVAQRGGLVGAFLAGLAFAIGWTPCIGPALAAITAFSVNAGDPLQSSVLFAAYSLGLGVPFLLSALFFVRSAARIAALRRHSGTVMRVSGVVLVVLGILLANGDLASISRTLGA